MLDQKKVDMLMYLEQEIIYSSDPAIQIKDKLKAIETYAKLAGFTAPTPTVIQQLNVQSDTQKELFNIFGIDDDSKQIEEKPEVIDAEIIETNEDPIEDF
jgi:ABC-type lipoprotein release transport system permease subunit